MANRFWVGGTASWDGTAGTKWATTSGGGGGAAVPTNADDVFFDGASGGVTVTTAAGVTCQSLTFTGFTGTFAGSNTLTMNGAAGSITIVAGMILSYTGSISLQGSGTKTIRTNGVVMASNLTIATTGTVSLLDAFTSGTANIITFNQGTFQDNGNNVSIGRFVFGNATARTLNLTAALWTLSGAGSVWTATAITNLTVTSLPTIIKFTGSTASAKLIDGMGLTYNNIWITGAGSGSYTITGSNTWLDFKIDKSVSFTTTMTAGTTQTFTTFNVRGTATITYSFVSSTNGTAWTLSCPSGVISCDYLSLKDSAATGGASFYAGTHSSNVSGNSGWVFTAPAYTLTAAQASYTLSGITTGLLSARKITAVLGTFTLSGINTAFIHGYTISAARGTFTFTGIDATLKAGRSLPVSTGTFILTGNVAAFNKGYYMPAGTKNFDFQGRPVSLIAGRFFSTVTGTFVLTGQNVILKADHKIAPVAGVFILNGIDADLIYTPAAVTSTGNFFPYMN